MTSNDNYKRTFDYLYIANELNRYFSNAHSKEIHAFSYMACVIWAYDENLPAEWGYQFVADKQGVPFSRHLYETEISLERTGKIVRDGSKVTLTETGNNVYSFLIENTFAKERAEYLNAALAVTLNRRPNEVFNLLVTGNYKLHNRQLLSESEINGRQIFKALDQLRTHLGGLSENLYISADVWMNKLAQ